MRVIWLAGIVVLLAGSSARTQSVDATASLVEWEKQCFLDAPKGCLELGLHHERAQQAARAATAFERGCEHGETRACVNAGNMYLQGTGVPISAARAAALYRQACNTGRTDGSTAAACANLAHLYRTGRGVARNFSTAVRLFDTACTSGSDAACFNLADWNEQGGGIPKDPVAATHYYRTACARSFAPACEALVRLGESPRAASPRRD